MTRHADAPMFGVAGLAILVGALTGSAPLLAASAVVGWVLVGRTLPRGGLVAALAVGLVWSNAAVVLSEKVGAPVLVALVPHVLMAAIVLGRMIVTRSAVVATPAFRALLLYGAALLLSGLFADNSAPVLERFQTFFIEGLLLWFLVVNVITDRRSLERALTALVVVAGFLGALTVIQYSTRTFTHDYAGFAQIDGDEMDLYRAIPDYTPRLSGSTGEKNRFAQVLLVTLPIAVTLANRQRGRAAAVYLGSAGLIVGGIAVSGSRGAAIGLVVTACVLVGLRVITARALGAVALAAAVVLIALPGYRQRVVSLVELTQGIDNPDAVDGSTLSRVTENLAALNMFLDHPLLGVGPGGYPIQYENYAEDVGLNVRDAEREPHNLYLGRAAELGLIGLGAFLVTVGTVLVGLYVARRELLRWDRDTADITSALIAGVIAYLVSGVFLHLSFERYLWLLLAVADAGARVARAHLWAPDETTPVDAGPRYAKT